MYVVCVTILVKPDFVEQFRQATLDNARNTRNEPGNVRFDVLQAEDDPNQFMLYEAYLVKEDFAKHQQRPHYFRWKESVADWMAQPRQAVKSTDLFWSDSK